MSQIFSQILGQQMRMEQRLTPQLIQSMAILQKPVADLEAYIEQALENNAALEIEEPESPDDQTRSDASPDPPPAVSSDEDGGFARLERFTRDFRDYDMDGIESRPPAMRRSSFSGERDPKMGAMANTAGRSAGLHELLLNQWALLDLTPDIRRAGELLINQLDPDGYLRVRLEELLDRAKPPVSLDDLKRALREVHRLEPTGIGARDVVECLLLQLDALPGDNRIERTLIEKHLLDIANNRLPAVSKATGYSIGEINEAIKAFRSTICLHPGYLVGDRTVPHIRPDVIVEYGDSGGGIDVRLARGNLPKLRIRPEVAALAKSRSNGKEDRAFARKHLEEATALIDAVHFRQSRLLEVALAVAEIQHDFFDVGPEGLKVCRMSDLADQLGCDPSTISRTVADKDMQTPRGIYPLRYFFTGGMETDDGQSVGWDRVKTRVRELIEAEDRKSPLNDDRIAEVLKKEGTAISRRTVAKYRQQLNIPAARQRREY